VSDGTPGPRRLERAALRELVAATRARLEWLRETGVEYVGAGLAAARLGAPPEATPPPPAASRTESGDAAAGRARTPESPAIADLFLPGEVRAADSLPDLRAAIGDCRRCKLAPHRTHLVFGVGNPRAALVFVGEAPGRDEDLKGEPFVGRAGQLLTEIIVKGMRLRRDDVYIANIIKCRPPQNRNPEPDEVASCEPFLIRQLELIRPKVIVALGNVATQVLLRTRTPITRLRGTWADYHGIPLMPTFHPAYLLRNPADKRLVWQDIRQVMATLGLTP
jgi:uracil-DNA glycosylase family 4